ncbi:MAG: DUF29 family protein [Chromatiaceae bacterium]|nr:DUF29 family protein [Chromatiaceae bacterium]
MTKRTHFNFEQKGGGHQTDYSTWATRHAEILRAGRYAELDIEHLFEELGDYYPGRECPDPKD